jgi:hypothetical protein
LAFACHTHAAIYYTFYKEYVVQESDNDECFA